MAKRFRKRFSRRYRRYRKTAGLNMHNRIANFAIPRIPGLKTDEIAIVKETINVLIPLGNLNFANA